MSLPVRRISHMLSFLCVRRWYDHNAERVFINNKKLNQLRSALIHVCTRKAQSHLHQNKSESGRAEGSNKRWTKGECRIAKVTA